MGFCIRMCLNFFCFVFHAKSATINSCRTGLSDILCESFFSLDSIDIKKFKKFFHC